MHWLARKRLAMLARTRVLWFYLRLLTGIGLLFFIAFLFLAHTDRLEPALQATRNFGHQLLIALWPRQEPPPSPPPPPGERQQPPAIQSPTVTQPPHAKYAMLALGFWNIIHAPWQSEEQIKSSMTQLMENVLGRGTIRSEENALVHKAYKELFNVSFGEDYLQQKRQQGR